MGRKLTTVSTNHPKYPKRSLGYPHDGPGAPLLSLDKVPYAS